MVDRAQRGGGGSVRSALPSGRSRERVSPSTVAAAKRVAREGRIARARGDAREANPYDAGRLAGLEAGVVASLFSGRAQVVEHLRLAWFQGWEEADAQLTNPPPGAVVRASERRAQLAFAEAKRAKAKDDEQVPPEARSTADGWDLLVLRAAAVHCSFESGIAEREALAEEGRAIAERFQAVAARMLGDGS